MFLKNLLCFFVTAKKTSDIYALEDSMDVSEFNELISDELYTWWENNRPIDNEKNGYTIREWNEDLFFEDAERTLVGAHVNCPGLHGTKGEAWINIYNGGHYEGEYFSFHVLEIKNDLTKIKLRIEGKCEDASILLVGFRYTLEIY